MPVYTKDIHLFAEVLKQMNGPACCKGKSIRITNGPHLTLGDAIQMQDSPLDSIE